MQGQIRWIAFAAVALAVIGFFMVVAPQTMPGAASAARQKALDEARAKIIDCRPNPAFERNRGFGSDWQFLRNLTDGSRIDFNPFTIACNPANGHRDVWVQITHKHSDIKKVEDATTIQEIAFNRERYRYRIDCIGRRFVLLDQQWMADAPEDIAHSERMSEGKDTDFREIEEGGIGGALIGPTCSTGRL